MQRRTFLHTTAKGVALAGMASCVPAETGRWNAIATSNFCGPQFKGMWRDIQWHQKMTGLIKHN